MEIDFQIVGALMAVLTLVFIFTGILVSWEGADEDETTL